MEPLRVIEAPYGWALQFGEGEIALFHTRLDAVGHANWVATQLGLSGPTPPVRVETAAAPPVAA